MLMLTVLAVQFNVDLLPRSSIDCSQQPELREFGDPRARKV